MQMGESTRYALLLDLSRCEQTFSHLQRLRRKPKLKRWLHKASCTHAIKMPYVFKDQRKSQLMKSNRHPHAKYLASAQGSAELQIAVPEMLCYAQTVSNNILTMNDAEAAAHADASTSWDVLS